MRQLQIQKLLQKQARQIKAIYDEFVHMLSELRKKHLDEFANLSRKLEQQKIEEIRKSIK